ncbi:MAG: cytidylate kinase-like family protein [Fimbriimonadaceae bacterium]|nr:cytidylate kinase-like family protein [Fimbriimonadaceae bacterium]
MGTLAISRQIGAGETTIAPVVAQRLGWRLLDREFLDREAADLGAPLPEVAAHDERAPRWTDRWFASENAERFFGALRRVVLRVAEEGNVVLVGRGAGFLLREQGALHVRLIADMPFRIRRVMEVRWVSEDRAKAIIRESDAHRIAYHRRFFDLDWTDPLQYDATIAASRLGIEGTTDLLVALARGVP